MVSLVARSGLTACKCKSTSPPTFAELYALTVGIPGPENRAVASAILAVLGVNLVSAGELEGCLGSANALPAHEPRVASESRTSSARRPLLSGRGGLPLRGIPGGDHGRYGKGGGKEERLKQHATFRDGRRQPAETARPRCSPWRRGASASPAASRGSRSASVHGKGCVLLPEALCLGGLCDASSWQGHPADGCLAGAALRLGSLQRAVEDVRWEVTRSLIQGLRVRIAVQRVSSYVWA